MQSLPYKTDNEVFDLEPESQITADFHEALHFLSGLAKVILRKTVITHDKQDLFAMIQMLLENVDKAFVDKKIGEATDWYLSTEIEAHNEGLTETKRNINLLLETLTGKRVS